MTVDYRSPRVARDYAAGRSLSDDVLARWGAAVTPLLPARPGLRVADIGAGTGIFAVAWPTWAPGCSVVAVEPADAMRAQMPAGVDTLGGRAERLPLRSGSVDVAWLSTVIHHTDMRACASELDRVLTADGVVLIRGLFADLGRPSALGLLPGWERALAAFPSAALVASAFTGWTCRARVEVEDAGPKTAGEAAARIRTLREADTLLGRFRTDEIDAGLADLDALPAEARLPPSTLGLLAFARD